MLRTNQNFHKKLLKIRNEKIRDEKNSEKISWRAIF